MLQYAVYKLRMLNSFFFLKFYLVSKIRILLELRLPYGSISLSGVGTFEICSPLSNELNALYNVTGRAA